MPFAPAGIFTVALAITVVFVFGLRLPAWGVGTVTTSCAVQGVLEAAQVTLLPLTFGAVRAGVAVAAGVGAGLTTGDDVRNVPGGELNDVPPSLLVALSR